MWLWNYLNGGNELKGIERNSDNNNNNSTIPFKIVILY